MSDLTIVPAKALISNEGELTTLARLSNGVTILNDGFFDINSEEDLNKFYSAVADLLDTEVEVEEELEEWLEDDKDTEEYWLEDDEEEPDTE